MKIFIFGANGMLGSYLHKYIRGSVSVVRSQVEAMKIQKNDFYFQLKQLEIKRGDVIINVIGIINKRIKEPIEFLTVNSLFPRVMADYCEKYGIGLIHISTDCVFNGLKGNYNETDLAGDTSIYGISKSAGEPRNCTIIRTSIIGENRNNSQDLLEWVRTHKNTIVTGWVNHIWNGITCLELARICKWIIDSNSFWFGVRHIFSPSPISKADLVEMISVIYELNNKIDKISGPYYCNRTLDTIYPLPYIIPELKVQIIEQKNFNF